MNTPPLVTIAHITPRVILPVSLLQGVFFALSRSFPAYRAVAIIVAGLQILFALRCLKTKDTGLLPFVLVLYMAQLGLFIAKPSIMEPQVPMRLIQVAIITGYLTSAVMILLTVTRLARPALASWLSFILGAGLFVAEATMGRGNVVQVTKQNLGSRLVSAMTSDPRFGWVNLPHSSVTAYYRGNPHSSFQEADPRENLWWLRVAGGSEARLVFPSTDLETERIEITRAASNTPYDIQLNEPRFTAKANSRYALSFRARADRPRQIAVGFSRAHGQWDGLGLYDGASLTRQWQTYSFEFVTHPNADDSDARVFFDVGDNDASVEVSAVHLRTLPDNAAVNPVTPPGTYAVTYNFNALGCRGTDYAIPKEHNVKRLLLLGNSYTLGSGIPDEAVVSSQLERLLNPQSGTAGSSLNYQVINCGISGYGTRQERQFYDLYGSKYEPDIVLVGVTGRDDVSLWEENDKANRSLGSLFYTWRALQNRLQPLPHTDFSGCVEELRQLDASVRRHGARLAVFVFRNNADYSGSTPSGQTWNKLTKAITDGFQGTHIPILDAGATLVRTDSAEELKAHSTMAFEPNAIAHAIAARELATFLERDKLLRP